MISDSLDEPAFIAIFDLAGSEDPNGGGNAAFKEGTCINQDLLGFQNIFMSYSEGRNPQFRGRKITEIMRPFFTNGDNYLIIHVDPSKSEETKRL